MLACTAKTTHGDLTKPIAHCQSIRCSWRSVGCAMTNLRQQNVNRFWHSKMVHRGKGFMLGMPMGLLDHRNCILCIYCLISCYGWLWHCWLLLYPISYALSAVLWFSYDLHDMTVGLILCYLTHTKTVTYFVYLHLSCLIFNLKFPFLVCLLLFYYHKDHNGSY